MMTTTSTSSDRGMKRTSEYEAGDVGQVYAPVVLEQRSSLRELGWERGG